MDHIVDTILALIAAHGQDAVAAAAVRTLPIITFAESNKAIGKYKDEVCDARKEIAVLNRLITNLEGEIKRQAAELTLNRVQGSHGSRIPEAELKAKEAKPATSLAPSLSQRLLACPNARLDPYNRDKILVEDEEGDLLAEAISLSGEMVLATIHCQNGSGSQVYMPLHHFLELYNRM